MDTRERLGAWWIPTLPDHRVTGFLTRKDGAWELKTIGRLEAVESDAEVFERADDGDGADVDSRNSSDRDDGLRLLPSVTIHGECSGTPVTVTSAYLTETHLPNRSTFHPARPGEDQYSESWTAHLVATGMHVLDSERFTGAELALDGLSDWWPTTAGRGRMRLSNVDAEDEDEPTLSVDSGDGWIIKLRARGSGHWGVWTVSRAIHSVVLVTREDGFTYSELWANVVEPLRALLAAAYGKPSRVTRLSCWAETALENADLPSAERADRQVDLWPIRGEDQPVAEFDLSAEPLIEPLHSHRMFFTSFDLRNRADPEDTTELKDFIRRWLALSRAHPLPTAMLDRDDRTANANLKVLQTLAAAEGLQRTYTVDLPVQTSTTNSKIMGKIERMNNAQGGTSEDRLNSKEIGRLKDTLVPREKSMAQRLASLAQALGSDFADWFFGGQVMEWSNVAAEVRNVIAHGYGLPKNHRLAEDPATLIAVLETTRVVVELRQLAEAGLPMRNGVRQLIERTDPTDWADPSDRAPAVFANAAYLAVRNQHLADWRSLYQRINIRSSMQ